MAQSDKNLVSLVAAEHIGPNETGDNIDAKRVALYAAPDGVNWQRHTGGAPRYGDVRFDADDSAPTYIGLNLSANASTSATNWILYKFTYDGANTTRIQSTTGTWDDRAAAF